MGNENVIEKLRKAKAAQAGAQTTGGNSVVDRLRAAKAAQQAATTPAPAPVQPVAPIAPVAAPHVAPAPSPTPAPSTDVAQYDPMTGAQISGPISNEPPPSQPADPRANLSPRDQRLNDLENLKPDWGSLPMGADPETDQYMGRDELDRKLYKSKLGVTYAIDVAYPDLNAQPRPLSEMSVGDFFKSAGNVSKAIVGGMIEGVRNPGRALRGETLTNAQAMNPGIYVPGAVGGPAVAAKAALPSVTPSLGMTGRTGATMAAALEKVPLVGNVIAKDAKRAYGQMSDLAKSIIEGVGISKSAYDAGRALQGDLKKFVDTTKAKMNDLYDRVYKVDGGLAPETPVTPQATVNALADAKAVFAQNPAIGKAVGANQWDAVLGELQSSGATWGALRQLRTDIGEAIGGSGVLSDQGIGKLKRIYGALTEDMTAAAKQMGPKVLQAWDRANAYTKGRAQRIEKDVAPMLEAQNPERAFELVKAAASEGRATSDVSRLASLKKSAGGAWDDTVASVIDRLGKAKAGVQTAEGDAFSPMTFLTEWNKVSPQAKAIMLPPEVRGQLDRLAKLTEAAKAGNLEKNMSNTSGPLLTGAIGAAAFTNPGKTLLGLSGTYLTAKLLTNPAVLRMMNDGIAGNFGRIKAMARGSDEAAQLARKLMVALPQLNQQGVQ